MTTMKIPIEALEMARMASTDETRPDLNWLEIRSEGDITQVTATDGHILGQFAWVGEGPEGGEPLYLWAADVRRILRMVSKKERQDGAFLEDGSLAMTGLSWQTIRVSTDVRFPISDNAIPDNELCPTEDPAGPGIKLSLDLKFLSLVHEWAKATNNGSVMDFTVRNSSTAVRLDVSLGESAALFVIMPCRM